MPTKKGSGASVPQNASPELEGHAVTAESMRERLQALNKQKGEIVTQIDSLSKMLIVINGQIAECNFWRSQLFPEA